MIERKRLPRLALSAFAMLTREFDARENALAQQTVEAMGLSEDDNWLVDFAKGEMTRDIPDPPQEPAVGG